MSTNASDEAVDRNGGCSRFFTTKEQTMNKLIWGLALWVLAACTFEWQPSHQYYEEEIGESRIWGPDLGGVGQDSVLHLPFAYGDTRLCTQGANEPFSHNGPATRYDLDLDTSNTQDEEVYAPASGVVYVHQDHLDTNFGRHVNIDLGDGTYAVVAHLEKVFVHNSHGVAAGQLLGLEGCTGFCTGDHIHLGRHQGSAWEEAHLGVSIPFDVKLQGRDAPLSSESFVCGLDDGQWYSSDLREVNSHANGSLVKSAQNPRVYLLDQGRKRWIEHQDIFWSLGYDFDQLLMISSDELNSYPNGSAISQVGEVRAAWDGMERLWMFVNDGQMRYRLPVGILNGPEVLASWGIDEEPMAYGSGTAELFDAWPAYQGWANFRDGSLIKEASRPDVYLVSDQTAVPIETWSVFLKAGYRPELIYTIMDGSVEYHFMSVGSCYQPDGICLREADLRQEGPMDLGVPEPPPLEPIVIAPDWDWQSDAGSAPDASEPFVSQPDASPVPDVSVFSNPDAGGLPDAARLDASEPFVGQPDAGLEPDAGHQPDAGIFPEPDAGGLPDAGETAVDPPLANSYLGVRWMTPFGIPAARITLSGEYVFADGSLGFAWHELKSVSETSEIFWSLYGASAGDRFRFSVEFEDASGYVSWSCIGPYAEGTDQQGTVQGSVLAHVDNQQIFAQTAGDPSKETTGCGLLLIVP